MTAIPEPTREDWKQFEKIEPLYSTLQEMIDDPIVTQDSIITCSDRIYDHQNTQQLLRLLAHFQRENERLTRQRDVLRLPFKLNPFCVEMAEKIMAGADGSISQGDADGFRDALTGEGGAA